MQNLAGGIMEGLKVMSFEAGHGLEIKCRFVSEWFKIDSLVSDKEKLSGEIKKWVQYPSQFPNNDFR